MNEIMNIGGVDCYEKDGTAYLKLETVARGLGFVDASKGTEYVRWNTVRQYLTEIGFSQEVAKTDFIPENIFYRLAMKAKNETAERFQAKVADEIIPSIRKHGAFLTEQKIEEILINPDTIINLATALKKEKEKTKALEVANAVHQQQIAELNPKATYYDLVLQCPDLISVTELAKDYGKSAKWLNKILAENKIQFKQSGIWFLYDKYAKKGYTSTKKDTFADKNGVMHTKAHTYWTQKGRLFLYSFLKELGHLPIVEQQQDAS